MALACHYRIASERARIGLTEVPLVGPSSEHWDRCFIVQYRSIESDIAMLGHPDYLQAATHFQAVVENARLIRLSPQPNGGVFG